MKKLLLLLVLAAAGCGGGEDPAPAALATAQAPNHGYGWEFDAQGQRGLRLRYSPHFVAGDWQATPTNYEMTADQIMQCMRMFAPMPFVIIVADGALDHYRSIAGNPANGVYLRNPSLIVLEKSSAMFFRHEMAHYLLDLNTGDADGDHSEEIARQCADNWVN